MLCDPRFPRTRILGSATFRNSAFSRTPLPLNIAAELNEAYAIEQPLSEIARETNCRACTESTTLAMATLREIAETDSNNTVWLEDLQLYEQERLKQIQREAGDALKRWGYGDGNCTLPRLVGTRWSELPPKALFDRVSGTRDKLIARQALP